MNKPKVSIITTAYNAEETISRCLDSVIRQTFKDFEMICVNDGSSDKTEEIIKSYAENDNRIKLVSQENSGPAKARNIALKYAKGQYIMAIDADDWWEEDMIETMLNALERENVDLVMCDTKIIDYSTGQESVNDYIKLRLKGYKDLTPNDLEFINVLFWNKIYKNEIINKYEIAYPTKYEHDDTIFFYKYIVRCKNFYGVDKKLYNYIDKNPNSIMGKLANKKNCGRELDFILCLQNLFDYFKKFKPSEEYMDKINDIIFRHIRYFYKTLSDDKQKEANKVLKDLVNKNSILWKHEKFNEIKHLRSAKNVKNVMLNIPIECSLLENIFSIKNNPERTHKILRIFGIKISFAKTKKKGKV